MKAIKNKWYGLYASILSVVLGILGLQSCADEVEYGSLYVEYGSPYADFLYTGTVTDEDDQPLEGEEVIIKVNHNYHQEERYFPINTVETNAAGTFTYKVDHVDVYEYPQKVRIVAIDKDDPEIKDSVEVEPVMTSQDKGWHTGSYLVKADIKLKKKK